MLAFDTDPGQRPVSEEETKLIAARERLVRAATCVVFLDPRTEDVPYTPDDRQPARVVISKRLRIDDLPGYGRVTADIPDIADVGTQGHAVCDFGMRHSPRPHLEKRELFSFSSSGAYYGHGFYDSLQDTYTEIEAFHDDTVANSQEIERRFNRLVISIEVSR